MAKNNNQNFNENPMAYFGNKSDELKAQITADIEAQGRYLRSIIDGIIGLSHLKTYLYDRVQTVLFNKKRIMHGLPPIHYNGEAIILSGAGDKNKSINYINKILYTAKIKKSLHISYLNAESIPTVWEDKTRTNVQSVVDEATDGLLVVHNLPALLSYMGEGGTYARYYLTRYLVETARNHQLIVVANRQDIEQWHMLCPEAKKLNTVYVHCEKYTPDDLTNQFIKMARDDGYMVAPYIVHKIAHVFSQLESPVFRKTSFNNVAKTVFNKCQNNQAKRLMELPDELQTMRRMRAFSKTDLVGLILASDNDVMVA